MTKRRADINKEGDSTAPPKRQKKDAAEKKVEDELAAAGASKKAKTSAGLSYATVVKGEEPRVAAAAAPPPPPYSNHAKNRLRMPMVCPICMQVNDHPYQNCGLYTFKELAIFVDLAEGRPEDNEEGSFTLISTPENWQTATLGDLEQLVNDCISQKAHESWRFFQYLPQSDDSHPATGTTEDFRLLPDVSKHPSELLSRFNVRPGGFIFAIRAAVEVGGLPLPPKTFADTSERHFQLAAAQALRLVVRRLRVSRDLQRELTSNLELQPFAAPSPVQPLSDGLDTTDSSLHMMVPDRVPQAMVDDPAVAMVVADHEAAVAAGAIVRANASSMSDGSGVLLPAGPQFQNMRQLLGQACRWADMAGSKESTDGAFEGASPPPALVPLRTPPPAKEMKPAVDPQPKPTDPQVKQKPQPKQKSKPKADVASPIVSPTLAEKEKKEEKIATSPSSGKGGQGSRKESVVVKGVGARAQSIDSDDVHPFVAVGTQLSTEWDSLPPSQAVARPLADVRRVLEEAALLRDNMPFYGVEKEGREGRNSAPASKEGPLKATISKNEFHKLSARQIARSVHIKQVSKELTDEELTVLLHRYGEFVKVRIRHDNSSLTKKLAWTYAFVEFVHEDAARRCFEDAGRRCRGHSWLMQEPLGPIMGAGYGDAELVAGPNKSISVVRCTFGKADMKLYHRPAVGMPSLPTTNGDNAELTGSAAPLPPRVTEKSPSIQGGRRVLSSSTVKSTPPTPTVPGITEEPPATPGGKRIRSVKASTGETIVAENSSMAAALSTPVTSPPEEPPTLSKKVTPGSAAVVKFTTATVDDDAKITTPVMSRPSVDSSISSSVARSPSLPHHPVDSLMSTIQSESSVTSKIASSPSRGLLNRTGVSDGGDQVGSSVSGGRGWSSGGSSTYAASPAIPHVRVHGQVDTMIESLILRRQRFLEASRSLQALPSVARPNSPQAAGAPHESDNIAHVQEKLMADLLETDRQLLPLQCRRYESNPTNAFYAAAFNTCTALIRQYHKQQQQRADPSSPQCRWSPQSAAWMTRLDLFRTTQLQIALQIMEKQNGEALVAAFDIFSSAAFATPAADLAGSPTAELNSLIGIVVLIEPTDAGSAVDMLRRVRAKAAADRMVSLVNFSLSLLPPPIATTTQAPTRIRDAVCPGVENVARATLAASINFSVFVQPA